MKTQNKPLLLPLLLVFILVAACGEGKKGNGSGLENGKIGSATISLENGKEIEFNATFSHVQSMMGKTLALSNPKNGLFLMLSVKDFSNQKQIGEGEYTEDSSIILKQQNYEDILKEEYRTYYYEGPDGEIGNAKITLTEVGENRISGTFSGTLYGKSGKKAVISNGQFDIEID